MKAITSVLTAMMICLASSGALADYNIDMGAIRDWRPQDVVITFSQDLGALGSEPNEAAVEQACLALTLAQFLRNPFMNGNNHYVNVTLFVRNDGVKLADRDLVAEISEWQMENGEQVSQERGCVAKDLSGEPAFFRLDVHLENFLDYVPENFVNCPICWCAEIGGCNESYVYDGYGILDEMAIPPLFLGADKVIDF